MRPKTTLILSLLLALLLSFPVFATDANTGSITLRMVDTSGKTVSSGTVSLTQITDLTITGNGTYAYTLTNGFEGSKISLDDLSAKDLPEKLQKAMTSVTKKTTTSVSADGKVVFSDLPQGIYLVEQTETAKGYEAMKPFVVAIPLFEDGKYIYEISASPKMERLVNVKTPVTPTAPTETKKAEEKKTTAVPTGDVSLSYILMAGITFIGAAGIKQAAKSDPYLVKDKNGREGV